MVARKKYTFLSVVYAIDDNFIFRFGTHVAGGEAIARHVRVNNQAPFDIRVDWEVYNMEEGDNQLLDFLVTYGQAFPLRDPHGNEIVPQDDDGTYTYTGMARTPSTYPFDALSSGMDAEV